MSTTRKGFTPSNYLERIKPPLVSFSIILVGIGLTAIGGILMYLHNTMELGDLPTVTLLLGAVLLTTSAGYLIGRNIRKSEAKRDDEENFRKWAIENYDVKLTNEQKDQLYNYGSTVVDGKRYILNYELDEDGNTTAYLFTEAELQESVETGLIETLNSVPKGFYPEEESELEEEPLTESNVPEKPKPVTQETPAK
jgi:hypothetical protein